MQTPKYLNGKRKKQVNMVSISIKFFLFLVRYHCGHPTRQCSMQNQVHLSAVDNDNIGQLANVVNWKHNVGPLAWGLEGRWRKKWVCSCITWKLAFFTMDEKASCMTLWDVVLSLPSTQQNRWIFMGFKGWPKMQCDKLRASGWGKPKLMHIQGRKHLKSNQKKGWMGEHTSKRLFLAMCKILNVCDGIQKQIRKDRKGWSCNLSKMFS